MISLSDAVRYQSNTRGNTYEFTSRTDRGEEYDRMSDTNLQAVLSALKNSKKLQHWDKPPKDFGPDNPEVGMGGQF